MIKKVNKFDDLAEVLRTEISTPSLFNGTSFRTVYKQLGWHPKHEVEKAYMFVVTKKAHYFRGAKFGKNNVYIIAMLYQARFRPY